MLNKNIKKNNTIKLKAELLVQNLIKNNKETYDKIIEPSKKEPNGKVAYKGTNIKDRSKIGNGGIIFNSKNDKNAQLIENSTKRKSNLEIFQRKVESSHDKIVRKMPQIKDNEFIIQSLIDKTNNTLNADLKVSCLGKSMLDYSVNRKNIHSVETKKNKADQVQYSDYKSVETKSVTKINFNYGQSEENKDNNIYRYRQKYETLNKIVEENTSPFVLNKESDTINYNIPSPKISKILINDHDYKIQSHKPIEPYVNKIGLNKNNKTSEKNNMNIIRNDNQGSYSLSKQNMIIEDVYQLQSKVNTNLYDHHIDLTNNNLNNKVIVENLDSSMNSIKNDLNSINNNVRKNSIISVKNSQNEKIQGTVNNKLNLEIQNSIQLNIDSPLNKITNFFLKEKDLTHINDLELDTNNLNLKNESKENDKGLYFSDECDCEEDVEEFKSNENINKVYKIETKLKEKKQIKNLKKNSQTENKKPPEEEEEKNNLNSIIRKYLFESTETNSNNDLNKSKASFLEKDLSTVSAQKIFFKKLKKNYMTEIRRLEKELKEIENFDVIIV